KLFLLLQKKKKGLLAWMFRLVVFYSIYKYIQEITKKEKNNQLKSYILKHFSYLSIKIKTLFN
ncbi:hypothetical protein, partial [Ureaplasma diversum]|uniref:hypothetical protein n=1 Tax=Ureaplasma diversum TaxID=42094 RepID=UPI001E3B6FDF